MECVGEPLLAVEFRFLLGRHHVLSGYFSLRRRWLSGLDVRSLGDLVEWLMNEAGEPVQMSDLPNVVLVHYADLRSDLEGEH